MSLTHHFLLLRKKLGAIFILPIFHAHSVVQELCITGINLGPSADVLCQNVHV